MNFRINGKKQFVEAEIKGVWKIFNDMKNRIIKNDSKHKITKAFEDLNKDKD